MNGGSWKIGAGGLHCSTGVISQDPGTVRTLAPLGSVLTRTDTASTGFTKYIVPGGSFGLDGAGGALANILTGQLRDRRRAPELTDPVSVSSGPPKWLGSG